MKKSLLVVLVAAVFLTFAATASAATDNLLEGAKAKLWRGLVNTFMGWVEIPVQIGKGYENGFMDDKNNKAIGSICGLLKGAEHAIGRTVYGVIDVVGCLAANPESNEGVGFPLDGEKAWEMGEPHDYFEPTFTEGSIKPMEKKLARGASNAVLGILEVPGQIKNGDNPAMGLVKGLWAFLSRELYGLADIVTILVPTPVEQLGVAFDEENPWDVLFVKE